MAVTIRDVAKSCGLSVSSVSKALNDYGDISESTKEMVRRTAREIGYYPNAIARTLKTNHSQNLGVLFVDENDSGITHPFFAAVLNAFKSEAESRGYDITFINHRIGTGGMTYLEHCRYRNVDGVCLACVNFYSQEVQDLLDSGLPCVTIDYEKSGCPAVLSDNRTGIIELVNRAVEAGHTRIAFIHGQETSDVTKARKQAFLDAMAEADLPVPQKYLVAARYVDPRACAKAVTALMNSDEPPTFILLPDDQSALGAMEAASRMGRKIPQDLSIAGYDGIRLMQMLHPHLTTVKQETDEIGRSAARILISRIEEPTRPLTGATLIQTSVLEGRTLAPVP